MKRSPSEANASEGDFIIDYSSFSMRLFFLITAMPTTAAMPSRRAVTVPSEVSGLTCSPPSGGGTGTAVRTAFSVTLDAGIVSVPSTGVV